MSNIALRAYQTPKRTSHRTAAEASVKGLARSSASLPVHTPPSANSRYPQLLQGNQPLGLNGITGCVLLLPEEGVQPSSDMQLKLNVLPGRHETNHGRTLCLKMS